MTCGRWSAEICFMKRMSRDQTILLCAGAAALFVALGYLRFQHLKVPVGQEADEAVADIQDLRGALLAKSKALIRSIVRDPTSVKWNDEGTWMDKGMVNVSLDFTTLNGFGGPVRETWYFMFSTDGKIVSLLTPKGEQIKSVRKSDSQPPLEVARERAPSEKKLAAKGEAKQEETQRLADMLPAAQAAMEGKTMAEIEGVHGKALNRDAVTGWAVWPKFRARFVNGRVLDVELP